MIDVIITVSFQFSLTKVKSKKHEIQDYVPFKSLVIIILYIELQLILTNKIRKKRDYLCNVIVR